MIQTALSAEAADALTIHGFVVLPGPFSAEALPRLQAAYDSACARAAPVSGAYSHDAGCPEECPTLSDPALAAGGPPGASARVTRGGVAPEKEELCLCGDGLVPAAETQAVR